MQPINMLNNDTASRVSISHAQFRLAEDKLLKIESLTINRGEFWAFVGANGSGKSALASAIAGSLVCLSGEYFNTFEKIGHLSAEIINKLISEEWERNNSDMLAENEIELGRTVTQVIQNDVQNKPRFLQITKQFGIEYLLDKKFKHLSSGETRKVMLCQLLMHDLDLLILDEPFEGLDVESRKQWATMISSAQQLSVTIVLVLNRYQDIPESASKLGILVELSLAEQGEKTALLNQHNVQQLSALEALSARTLPEPPNNRVSYPNTSAKIILNNGFVKYDETYILKNLNWQLLPSQHWHIVGENGVGKSTLLNLITGDHPQGYINDLTLFGRKRGSGETIWDIKQHIGFVSGHLHSSYRVHTNLRTVILSGFYDSIGLYQTPSEEHKKLTQDWIAFVGITPEQADAPFHSLSYGLQRLALIIRAFVKYPPLLILDEPFQGLDTLNREWIKQWIDRLITISDTQLLFVSHHIEDAPQVITHRLTLFKDQTTLIETV